VKKIKLIIVAVLVLFAVTGCGKPKDKSNQNLIYPITANEVTSVDVYYDNTPSMTRFISDPLYAEIVYAATSSAKDIWYNNNCTLYQVTDTITESSMDYLTTGINDENTYQGNSANVLKTILPSIKENSMNVIITDLNSQLDDYSTVANLIVHNALQKGMAVAFIGVETEITSFFIIAIGDNVNLSKYVEAFKNNPSVEKYSQSSEDGVQIDIPQRINYQIIANKSGINGIKYDKVTYVEKGKYLDDEGKFTQIDEKGSFDSLRDTYKAADLDTIEGTVNFTPNVPQFVSVGRQKGKGAGVGKFLGMKSLVLNKKDDIAGKIKLDIPFDVISGVKLSKLDCEVDLKTYYSDGGAFREQEFEGIYVTIADGATEEQGKWRVDDKNNSIIFNINFENAGIIKSDKGVLKLDMTFRYYDSINTTSNWITVWDGTRVKNLKNLFNSLYLYQKDANTSENRFTFYVGAGNKSLNNRATRAKEN